MPFDESQALAANTAHVEVTNLRSLLSYVANDDVELAVWARNLPALENAGLVAPFSDVRFGGGLDTVLAQIPSAIASCGLPSGLTKRLRLDAVTTIRRFEAFYPGTAFDVRVEYVEDNACRRYHQDNTDWRLITTYKGPGTDWILVDGSASGQLATGHVGLLRGTRADRPPRLLHRSPQIEATQETRVIMVIDLERASFLSAED